MSTKMYKRFPYHLNSRGLRGLLIVLVFGVFLFHQATRAQNMVADTPHNMSTSSPGEVKAVDETRICIFCHTPHQADSQAPLWNRYETTTNFTIYPSGGSMQSTPLQPNGSSLLCLSCHDGSTALGIVRNRPTAIPLQGVTPEGYLPAGTTNLGISLADDHPISLIPSLDDPEIALPGPTDPVKLDANGYLQCRSCHDPHNDSRGKFLVMDNTESAMCIICHQKTDWDISIHGHPQDPQYSQLITQACSTCHVPHSAPEAPRLLTMSEENLCFACHDGVQNAPWETSGATDLVQEFQKTSIHPITINPGEHDPGEGPVNSFPPPSKFLPEQNPTDLRHVECVDCHNPHSANDTDAPGEINSALNNLWGVDANGIKIDVATKEYQICFKCHSESANLPANEHNKRLEFATTNASYHPVEAPGTNTNVPSLLPPWTESSVMNCTDCHGNDDENGPEGPHGSVHYPILKGNYYTGIEPQNESTFLYELCYSCHDRSVLRQRGMWPETFRRHRTHDEFSCFKCHASHGSTENTHLIRFDENDPYIEPSSSGRLEYNDFGNNSGQCYIRCHGRNHNPKNY